LPALTLEAVKAINIEVSSKCNAACPFCSRRQKVRPYAGQLITLADFKLLPASVIRQLRRLTFGGNFGDLCCNPEVLAIAAYIRQLNPDIILEGDTNGSYGAPEWWRALGASFKKGAMVFALDGLEDTHRLHRRGTDFQRIIRNMRAFVAGGGTAQWQFIVFKHNEHQLQAAEDLAQEIGCRRFYAMASRDFSPDLVPPASIDFRIKRDVFAGCREELVGDDRQALCTGCTSPSTTRSSASSRRWWKNTTSGSISKPAPWPKLSGDRILQKCSRIQLPMPIVRPSVTGSASRSAGSW
jgi:MoaA/NifB/PqqE/SkfB family radical SAM enzyme